MNVEQRVRTALREDGDRLEVPPAPPVSDLVRARGRYWSVAGLAAAAVLLVVVVVMADRSGPAGVDIGPVDEPAPSASSSEQWRFVATGTTGDLNWTLDALRLGDDLCLRYETEGDDGASGRNCAAADPGSSDQHVFLDFGWPGPDPLIGHVSQRVVTMELRYAEGPPSLARLHRTNELGATLFVIDQDPGRERTLLIARDASAAEIFRVDIAFDEKDRAREMAERERPPIEEPAHSDRSLDAGVFVSEFVDPGDNAELFDGVDVTVEVGAVGEEPWVSWQAACNTASAPVRLDGGRLALRDDVITTAMACDDPEQTEQDQWLAEFFESGPQWERTGDGLQLKSVDGTSEIVFVRQAVDAEQ